MIKGSILVVDDDPLVRMNTVDTLLDAGYACSVADSLAAGWSMLSHRRFDLVVCDHDLGDGKGSVLARRLDEKGDDTPFVFLSAAGDALDEELSGVSRVKRILRKPSTASSLLAAVSECLVKASDDNLYPRLIGEDERERLLGRLNPEP
jgi:DNA-binding response OmpR family regulator